MVELGAEGTWVKDFLEQSYHTAFVYVREKDTHCVCVPGLSCPLPKLIPADTPSLPRGDCV